MMSRTVAIPCALAVMAGFIVTSLTLNVTAQEILSPTLKWKSESIFTANIKHRLELAPVKFLPFLNVERAVSVTAIPLLKSPIAEMRDLEARPNTIGALYLPSGSLRFKLEPGLYRVEIAKEADGWRARFLDEKGTESGRTRADVRPAEAVQIPFATVEHSVCYRFDKAVVCI